MPEGSDIPPVAEAVRFDLNDPFEVRAGPFWYTAALEKTAGDTALRSREFWLRVQERHCNTSSIVHGGLLMTMADLTMADAARDGNGDWVTISFDSHFVASAQLGDLLHSIAVCTRRTSRTAFVRGVVSSRSEDASDQTTTSKEIFTFSGVFSRVGGTTPSRL